MLIQKRRANVLPAPRAEETAVVSRGVASIDEAVWLGAPDVRTASRGAPQASITALAIPASLLIAIVTVPLLALFWRAVSSGSLLASLGTPLVREGLRLTFTTTSITLLFVAICGTPLAYLLARRSFTGKRLVELAVDLPLVLPPVVAGVALLIAFGRRGLFGPSLESVGIELPFSTAAVVIAQIFVAGPFYVRSATVGFAGIDPSVEEAAAIDGASTWLSLRYVTLPLAAPAIASGAVLCFGRAVSEFGATLMFAGNFIGKTQTMSLAVVYAMEADLEAALALAVLMVLAAGLVLLAARMLAAGRMAP
jgi:molybdate transport system permease protein